MKNRNGLLWGKYLKPPLWSTIVSLEFGWCLSCKKRLTFSMRNPLPTCTSMAATFLSCSICSHSCATDGKEKRRHDRLSSFLVPAWLHKTMNPVRPYSSWEPQGNSERLYSPLFEFLQSFMLYFLLKTASGKWVVLFWFHPACCFWGRRPPSEGGGTKCELQNCHCLWWSGRNPGNPWNTQNALCEGI